MAEPDPTWDPHHELDAILADPDMRGARLAEAVRGALTIRSGEPYRFVVRTVAALDLQEDEAHAALTAIEQRRADIESRLGRDPGFVVAALEWLDEGEPRIRQPVFRDHLQGSAATPGSPAAASAAGLPPEEDEASRGERYGRPVACVALGPDSSETDAGPALAAATARVRDAARDVDHAAAIGGALRLILPCTAEEGALRAAERWRRLLQDSTGLAWSAGVASSPDPVREARAVSGRAGQALRAARAAGGDRVVAYRPEKRVHVRWPARGRLTGGLAGDSGETPAAIEDLSLGGALVRTAVALPPGHDIVLALRETTARPRAILLAGRVDRCTAAVDPTGPPWRTAVVFRGDGESRLRLAGLIADLESGRPGGRAERS